MELKQLLNDDDAVSPVIGVILMVAITVILAAVIGTFVLGLGDQVQTTAPNAQFSFDWNEGTENLTITHNGGDGIDAGEVVLTGDVHQSGASWADRIDDYDPDDPVRAGGDVEVANATTSLDGRYNWSSTPPGSDAEVNVVWQDADSDQSSTLRTWSRN